MFRGHICGSREGAWGAPELLLLGSGVAGPLGLSHSPCGAQLMLRTFPLPFSPACPPVRAGS